MICLTNVRGIARLTRQSIRYEIGVIEIANLAVTGDHDPGTSDDQFASVKVRHQHSNDCFPLAARDQEASDAQTWDSQEESDGAKEGAPDQRN